MFVSVTVICIFLGLFVVYLISKNLHPAYNISLQESGQPEKPYTFNQFLAEGNRVGDNFIIVSLSGGGARAGALAYGVLKELESYKFSDGKSFLDSVNVLSSVSGGSFASAYYGLYGKDRFLKEYRDKVLYHNLTDSLALRYYGLFNWLPQTFTKELGRSDFVQGLYDKYFFEGKTFSDLPRKWPFIVINTTDMTLGNPVSFIQEDFNYLGSDLSSFPISRAVAASSAFPGLLSPLTVKNYKKEAGLPEWVKREFDNHPDDNPQHYAWAKDVASFWDVENRPFIHLTDGGVSDNLGLRPLLYHFRTGSWNMTDQKREFIPKRIIVIAVDAKGNPKLKRDKSSRVPGVMDTMNSASRMPIKKFSAKTIEEISMRFKENQRSSGNYEHIKNLCDQLHSSEEDRKACYAKYRAPFDNETREKMPEFHLVHLHTDVLKDPERRDRFGVIKTDLQVANEDVDFIIETASHMLKGSKSFQKLIETLSIQKEENNENA